MRFSRTSIIVPFTCTHFLLITKSIDYTKKNPRELNNTLSPPDVLQKKREDTIFNSTNSFFSVLVINYLNELKRVKVYTIWNQSRYTFLEVIEYNQLLKTTFLLHHPVVCRNYIFWRIFRQRSLFSRHIQIYALEYIKPTVEH